MPYLPTSQEYLEQSALLLHAYPDTTRITTKYSYPTSKKSSTAQPTSAQPNPSAPDASTTPTQKQTQTQTQSQSQSQTTATLTLKTFHPTSGICLKYRTNKAAEIGRLIAGLGKLASGAPDAETAVAAVTGADAAAAAASSVGMAGDAEMVDASAHAATPGLGTVAGGKGSSGNGGGKSKKKTKGKK
ncbi:conserved hypothetical protein [Histoplasma capsulatum var. duboisii H88]|uniref:Signal recognition particle 9 kDa protein SRP9 superfamily domain-containing protein n=1 Tax=Ajellomyces capsulatus (strain H88) TaxID=544711 RepID=F0UDT1_AJEC8|nr:conserved hypothetical protein [Histoplasma capsulatum var. duboisii H88]QSS55280.1 signal recognition particle 9 kDa protein SRP9 superfamily domain-containing protein [Histoplasma capsulatum var. duboisii H88]